MSSRYHPDAFTQDVEVETECRSNTRFMIDEDE